MIVTVARIATKGKVSMARKLFFLLVAALVVGGFATSLGSTVGAAQDVGTATNRNPVRARSYINPDTGLATENPNVNRNSECGTPDQADRQMLSDPGATNNNVHNDACLFRDGERFDGKASFEIMGVGTFSACPDPDGAGPKTSVNSGKRCYMTGYQTTGMDGDTEYHARINNSTNPGTTDVTFCSDPQNNGCRDAASSDKIVIRWVR